MKYRTKDLMMKMINIINVILILVLFAVMLSGCGQKSESGTVSEKQKAAGNSKTEKIDCDLTKMGSDMIYSTVYQMMAEPDSYVGKTVKMEGLYYPAYYEAGGEYCHYCIIQDATACCAQGIEFVWDDGSHVYPDEYPEENAQIVVQGTFETYKEEGDDNLYCRLKDATMEVETDSSENGK